MKKVMASFFDNILSLRIETMQCKSNFVFWPLENFSNRMNTLFKSYIFLADRLNEWIGNIISWLTGILVVLVCGHVIIRYILEQDKVWLMELEWHLFALIFLLGAGYALKHDRHVRVDLFYSNFSEKDKAVVNFWGGIIFLIPWCIVLIYASFNYAYESWKIGEGSADPGGLPARYLIKFSICIGLVLLLIQALAEVAKSYLTIKGHVWEKTPSGNDRKINEQL